MRSSGRLKELEAEFGDRTFFESLRLEPYYAYTAGRIPEAAAFFERLQHDTRSVRSTLVHGDLTQTSSSGTRLSYSSTTRSPISVIRPSTSASRLRISSPKRDTSPMCELVCSRSLASTGCATRRSPRASTGIPASKRASSDTRLHACSQELRAAQLRVLRPISETAPAGSSPRLDEQAARHDRGTCGRMGAGTDLKLSTIASLSALEILDSRGRPTLKVACSLGSGASATASVPSGASRGAAEAAELRDGDAARYSGFGCRRAVRAVEGEIASTICGNRFAGPDALDGALRELDGTPTKSRLGANTILAVSLAFARAAAAESGSPLLSVPSPAGGHRCRQCPDRS